VLLLHGWACDGSDWSWLAADLARDHRVIIPDHGGARVSSVRTEFSNLFTIFAEAYRRVVTTDTNVALPRDVDGIDAEFLSRALGSRYPGTFIEAVEVTDAHQGSGSTFRLALTYADDPHNVPESVYLKANFVAHGYTSDAAFLGEACYFAEFADRTSRLLNQPAGLFSGADNNGQAIVLIEDLTRRPVTFNDCESPLTVGQVADGVGQLAALHASFWADSLPTHAWLSDQGALAPPMMYLVQPAHFDGYINRERAALLSEPLKDRQRIATALAAMFLNDECMPKTLCHGDPHLGNTFLDADGRVGFLDFQTVGRGSYIWDVTYFMTGALAPVDRRAAERDLLDGYREALLGRGVENVPSREDMFLAHRQHMMHGYLNILTPVEMQPDQFAVSMGQRFAEAMEDLDTLGSFDRLSPRIAPQNGTDSPITEETMTDINADEATTSATQRLTKLADQRTSPDGMFAFYDSLPPVTVSEMLGSWKGAGVDTGNPFDGVLEKMGWRGKRFDGPDDVHPLVMVGSDGELFHLSKSGRSSDSRRMLFPSLPVAH